MKVYTIVKLQYNEQTMESVNTGAIYKVYFDKIKAEKHMLNLNNACTNPYYPTKYIIVESEVED